MQHLVRFDSVIVNHESGVLEGNVFGQIYYNILHLERLRKLTKYLTALAVVPSKSKPTCYN
jgi:hypothetical protein